LDAATGQLLQDERLPGPGSYYASPVSGDGKVYFASEQGVISVLANQREWKVLSSHDLHEKIYATPAIEHRSIYVRTSKALYRFGVAEDVRDSSPPHNSRAL
jgi:outer membrane protein assembly factor BamB